MAQSVKRDRAMLGITDAFMTLAILSLASFVLFKASLAPATAAEASQREAFILEVGALHTALDRSTVPYTQFTDSGKALPRENFRVAKLVSEIHYFFTAGKGVGVEDARAKIMANAETLTGGRWDVSFDVRDPAGATICIGARVTSGPCDVPGTRYASTIMLPKANAASGMLESTLYATRGVGR